MHLSSIHNLLQGVDITQVHAPILLTFLVTTMVTCSGYCTYTDVNTSFFFVDDNVNLFLKTQCEEWVVFGSLSTSVHSIVTVVAI